MKIGICWMFTIIVANIYETDNQGSKIITTTTSWGFAHVDYQISGIYFTLTYTTAYQHYMVGKKPLRHFKYFKDWCQIRPLYFVGPRTRWPTGSKMGMGEMSCLLSLPWYFKWRQHFGGMYSTCMHIPKWLSVDHVTENLFSECAANPKYT